MRSSCLLFCSATVHQFVSIIDDHTQAKDQTRLAISESKAARNVFPGKGLLDISADSLLFTGLPRFLAGSSPALALIAAPTLAIAPTPLSTVCRKSSQLEDNPKLNGFH